MKARFEALNKPGTWLAMAAAVMLLGVATWGRRSHASQAMEVKPAANPVGPARPTTAQTVAPGRPAQVEASASPIANKAERVKKILRDYADIQAKMSADYGAAGPTFPGGLSAFLRQLALLEREKRKDLAKVMAPRELEDYEIGETAAGQRMRGLLDGTMATDEQRRAVFRAEQAFDDQYGFTFDLTPAAQADRVAARQATQEQVRSVLGDTLFAAWLRDDPTYAHAITFAQQQNLGSDAALALWQARNKLTLLALAIPGAPPEKVDAMRTALLQWGRSNVTGIAGLAAPEVVEREVASWLGQSSSAARP